MKAAKKIGQYGFTLVEMMLVIVIISSLLLMSIQYYQKKVHEERADKLAMQIQQILNAALSYYIKNGTWPPAPSYKIDCLQGKPNIDSTCFAYLPTNMVNPLGGVFYMGPGGPGGGIFIVDATIVVNGAAGLAAYIANKLPSSTTRNPDASTPCTSQTHCTVTGVTTIPAKNLNSAPAMHFAGVYHHGACVPVPKCPVDTNGTTMTPQITVVPIQVSGVNDDNSTDVYPISSFTAYATGPNTAPVNGNVIQPPGCIGGEDGAVPCGVTAANENNQFSQRYWRVCMQVITEKGNVQSTRTDFAWFTTYAKGWGGYATMAAFTRCMISNETSGTRFDYENPTPSNSMGPMLKIFGK